MYSLATAVTDAMAAEAAEAAEATAVAKGKGINEVTK